MTSAPAIGIDGRLYRGNHTGIGVYTRHLVDHLARLDPEGNYVLFTDRPQPPPDGPFRVVSLPLRKRALWTQLLLPGSLAAHGIRLFHAVANHDAPVVRPCPVVVTVHDLIPLIHPETVSRRHRSLFSLFIGRAVRGAAAVIADSEFVRASILDRFAIPPERVRVVPLACDAAFHRLEEPAETERIAASYRLRRPYVLYVGAFEPRKNVGDLVGAFARAAERPEFADWQLVLAGGGGWGREEVLAAVAAAGLGDRIRVIGLVPPEDLPSLYRGASLFVYPSRYEGFGLPVLEAMAAGVPVLVSAPSALTELTGPAGATFRLDLAGDLEARLARLLADGGERDRLAAAGRERAAAFSWERCARETLAIYREVLGR
jgi:glycosyltransferase involved in cell wall biosynthesis